MSYMGKSGFEGVIIEVPYYLEGKEIAGGDPPRERIKQQLESEGGEGDVRLVSSKFFKEVCEYALKGLRAGPKRLISIS
jgi:hypothetical protein